MNGTSREELFEAIRVVHSGGSLSQPLLTSKLLQNVSREQSQIEHEAFTERGSEVLQLIARGLQNKEIAAELVIGERSDNFHVSSILGKLGAGNRTESVCIVTQRGLVEL